ncbi:hypothetical protein D3C72_2184920 [compost metagenome]
MTLPAEPIVRLPVLVDAHTLPFVPSAFKVTLLPVIVPDVREMVGLSTLFA